MDGEAHSFAEECAKWAREGLTHLKPEAMNAKRQQKSKTAERKFCTYTEDDIKAAPEIKSIGPQLTQDKPAGRKAPEQVAHDKLGEARHSHYHSAPERGVGAMATSVADDLVESSWKIPHPRPSVSCSARGGQLRGSGGGQKGPSAIFPHNRTVRPIDQRKGERGHIKKTVSVLLSKKNVLFAT